MRGNARVGAWHQIIESVLATKVGCLQHSEPNVTVRQGFLPVAFDVHCKIQLGVWELHGQHSYRKSLALRNLASARAWNGTTSIPCADIVTCLVLSDPPTTKIVLGVTERIVQGCEGPKPPAPRLNAWKHLCCFGDQQQFPHFSFKCRLPSSQIGFSLDPRERTEHITIWCINHFGHSGHRTSPPSAWQISTFFWLQTQHINIGSPATRSEDSPLTQAITRQSCLCLHAFPCPDSHPTLILLQSQYGHGESGLTMDCGK